MIRAQRLLLIIALPIIALCLHTCYSNWSINELIPPGWTPPLVVIGWTTDTPQGLRITGVTTGQGSYDKGVWFAVVIPLSLVIASAYLLLGGLHRARIEKGLCANCGYDLRGQRTPGKGANQTIKCPECGRAS